MSVYKHGRFWWFRFRFNGQRIQENTRVTNQKDARAIEAARRTQLAKGEVGLTPKSTMMFEALIQKLEDDWRRNARRDLKSLPGRLAHLRKYFGKTSAESITTADIEAYIKVRQTEGKAAAGTINRELSALKRAFRLALRGKLLESMPYIPMLTEPPARQGFFDADKFEAVVSRLPAHLQPVARFAHLTGWRRSEVTGLTWDFVDLKERSIRLPGSMSKNGKPRFLPLEGPLWGIIDAQRQTVGCTKVFHKSGRPIRTFYKAWTRACQQAGCPGMLFHDFRRTAARNLRRAGLSEQEAMLFTGHVTPSVFRRYYIVTEDDHRQAARLAFASETGEEAGPDGASSALATG